MVDDTARRLERNIDKILAIWEERVTQEVAAAHHQSKIALRNSLPDYLLQLVDALSTTIDRTSARMKRDKIDSTRTGRKHGEDRAGSLNYTIDQLISEYHILRQVLWEVIEQEAPLTGLEREVIVCSIEQAVNDAATKYTDTLTELKEKVSSTLAHDLRSPLAIGKLSAQLILRRLGEDDPSVPMAQQIIRNMDRIDQMITGLLDASRLAAGESMPVLLEHCDLDSITRQVTEDLNLSHPDCFRVHLQGPCHGYWDESGLRRVLENLITNAVKYGDVTQPITISLEHDQDFAELRVHNYGNPIPRSQTQDLFQQYRRLESSRLAPGWGLGLTMVKGMVDAHHGSIALKSEEQEGTTFLIRLPKDARSGRRILEAQSPEDANRVEQVPQIPKSTPSFYRH